MWPSASAGTSALDRHLQHQPDDHQTYLYENTSYPFALTGITDENGNRYATWGYDGNGRGILSELAGAVNYRSVYYDDSNGNRTVKGPLGIVETYNSRPCRACRRSPRSTAPPIPPSRRPRNLHL